MTCMEISEAYGEAEKIIFDAEVATVNTHVVWEKLQRVMRYIRSRAEEELREVLS